ncbi:MAG: UDP-3-O-(3-hydroxymyristoyl)glucosamine N-acyltransferase [Planctomycetes bacterium]|nr:UDP-3-O-(3-hydroxymyristoyl)glucosamine N-acyltransferase [Planctomycetota bacterium]
MSRTYTVREIAANIGGEVLGDPERRISGVCSLRAAEREHLVFVDSPKHLEDLRASRAGCALVPEGIEPPPDMSGIRVRQPAHAMARAVDILAPPARSFEGVSPQAVLGKGVELGPGVGIGPMVYIGDGVRIGRGTEVHPGVTVGRGATIGEDCVLHSGVHVYHETAIGNRVIIHSGAVLGADGFGFVQEKAPGVDSESEEPLRHRKVRQVGRVVIEDDVEIGANTTIDRAALHETRVRRGTKIDDLVMIGHNCTVGRHCILVAQAGISGSTTLGDYVTIAGQAGIAGHLRIGTRAVVGAQSGVTKDIGDAQIVLGSPAIDARQARKALTLIDSLPEFKKSIAAHEKRLAKLEGKVTPPSGEAPEG